MNPNTFVTPSGMLVEIAYNFTDGSWFLRWEDGLGLVIHSWTKLLEHATKSDWKHIDTDEAKRRLSERDSSSTSEP